MNLDALYPGEWAFYLFPACGPACGCSNEGKAPHRRNHQKTCLWVHEAILDGNAANLEQSLASVSDRWPTFKTLPPQWTREAWLELLAAHHAGGGNLALTCPPHSLFLDIDKTLSGEDPTPENEAEWAIKSLRETFDPDLFPVQASGKRVDHKAVGAHVAVSFELGGWNHYGQMPVTLRVPGQYIIVEPSVRFEGVQYQWVGEGLPRTLELPELPNPALALAKPHPRSKHSTLRTDARDVGEWRAATAQWWRDRINDPAERFSAGERHYACRQLCWIRIWEAPIPDADTIAADAETFLDERCEGFESPSERAKRSGLIRDMIASGIQKRHAFLDARAEQERAENPTTSTPAPTGTTGPEPKPKAAHLRLVDPAETPDETPQEPISEPQAAELTPRVDFPFEVLPEPIQRLARTLSDVHQVDPLLPALVALGAVSTVAVHRARIHVFGAWLEELAFWALLTTKSGAGKSPIFRKIERALRDIEEDEERARRKRNARLVAKGKEDPEQSGAYKAAVAPTPFKLFDTEPTPEAYAVGLAKLNSAYSILSEEGRGLLQLLGGNYRSGRLENISPFLVAYDGGTLRASRVTREQPPVNDAIGALVLMTQRDAYEEFLSTGAFTTSGLHARFLTVEVQSWIGRRKRASERDAQDEAAIEYFRSIIQALWHVPWAQTDDGTEFAGPPPPWPRGRIEPHVIPSSPESEAVFDQLGADLEPLFRHGQILEDEHEMGNKLVGKAARLAGLFHMIEHPHHGEWERVPLDADTATRGAEIVRYVLSLPYARELEQQAAADASLERVMRWAQNNADSDGNFVWRKVANGVKRGRIRDANHLREILGDLVAEGRLAVVGRDDKKRPNRWQIA